MSLINYTATDMGSLLIFIAGVAVGAAIVFLTSRTRQRDIAQSFSALSLEALRRNSEEFLKLANLALSNQAQTGLGELSSKKELIDRTLDSMKIDLQKVERSITESDKRREKTFGEVSMQLKLAADQTARLHETTGKLQAALASTKTRGQWGERMAEDVLRTAGLVEGINYLKQKLQESGSTRPDYTFLLPQDLKVNMDVKFPLDNYMKYLNEDSEPVKQNHKEQFLRDARLRIKEVTTRDYINPEANTVDYVIVFIPSEPVYRFIMENDGALMDEALRNRVILCSPLTLFALLAVMTRAVENFNVQKTSAQILSLFGTFYKQWDAFKKCLDRMGERIEQAHDEYQTLVSTRKKKLEAPLKQIDDLRRQKGIVESTPAVDKATAEPDEPDP